MNRRDFLKLTGIASGGLVATATMAEAGFFADFLSWVKRRPVWSIPKTTSAEVLQYSDYTSFTDISLATAIDPIVEQATNELGYRAAILLNTVSADSLLPELRWSINSGNAWSLPLLSAARKAEIDAEFNRNGGLAGVENKIKEHNGHIHAAQTWQADKDTLCYTKNEKHETCRVVINKTTNKIDLLPITSLAFNT